MFGKAMGNFSRHPNVAAATKVGDPTLVDPKPVSATEVVQAANRALLGTAASDNKVAGEIINSGAPKPNEAAPRSDSPAAATPAGTDGSASEAATPGAGAPAATDNSGSSQPDNSNNGIPELKPNVPDDSGGQNTPPPAQLNEIQQGQDAPASAAGTSDSKAQTDTASSSSSTKQQEEDQNVSSSRKKKKKHKLFPF